MAKVETYQHPELGDALRYLRARRDLSQARLAERVTASGRRVTSVWLSRIENPDPDAEKPGPYPSVLLLERILAVLGADLDELGRLLADRPWTRVDEGAEWADAGAAPAFAAASAGPRSAGRAAVMAEPAAVPPAGVAAEAAELGAIYAGLSRRDQEALLADARRRSTHTP